jgi:integrase
MPAMGRRRSRNHGLPPHMARKGDYYYYVTHSKPRRWIPLGDHYGTALAAWARHEGTDVPAGARTFIQVANLYRREELPKKAPRTRHDNEAELKRLEAVFGDSPLETIRPVDVRRYLNERMSTKKLKEGEAPKSAGVRANREIALLSHVINFARARGVVEMANPCAGVRKNKEVGRERYLDDVEYAVIYAKADEVLRDALDLLLLTSQRPGDVIAMKRQSIRDGSLQVRQGKTGTKLRIRVEGELAVAIERMNTRTRRATGVYLVQDEDGQPLTYWMLEGRFAKAREAAALEVPSVADVQLRDLRGKAATDAGDLAHAQALLGHSSRAMTEHYTKKRLGDTVSPLERKKRPEL